MKKILLSVSLSFLIIISSCICALADTIDLATPELDPPAYDSYLILSRVNDFGENRYYCWLYNSTDWTPTVNSEGTLITWTKNRETAYVKYFTYRDESEYNKDGYNGGWGTFVEYDDSLFLSSNGFTIHKSSIDIYDDKGLLFFQGLPLEKVIQKTLTEKMIPMMVGALKILVPCGVGCLALLIVLKLFGKKSLIFRA